MAQYWDQNVFSNFYNGSWAVLETLDSLIKKKGCLFSSVSHPVSKTTLLFLSCSCVVCVVNPFCCRGDVFERVRRKVGSTFPFPKIHFSTPTNYLSSSLILTAEWSKKFLQRFVLLKHKTLLYRGWWSYLSTFMVNNTPIKGPSITFYMFLFRLLDTGVVFS